MNPDAVNWQWLDRAEELDRRCAQWAALGVVGIDTEFVRTRTFFARLGLVQVHAGDENFLIDPLAIADLGALHALLADAAVTKVIHSGSEDIEIFNRLGDAPLQRFFDTQVAAALAGLGPSLSYQALVQELLGIEVDKGQTRSDWLRRPLSHSQQRYAALDVAWLPEIHARLHARLDQLGRLEWLQEDCDLMLAEITEADAVADQYRKSKLAWRLDDPGRAVLWSLLQWRERTARRRDRPRKHILSDNDLLTLARSRPADVAALEGLELEQPRAVRRHADGLLRAIERARSGADAPEPPPEPLDPSHRRTIKDLRRQVGLTAERLGIAPEVLCGKREVVHVLQYGAPSPRLDGWRLSLLRGTFDPYLESPA